MFEFSKPGYALSLAVTAVTLRRAKGMATSSILGGRRLPEQISGKSTGALGPSDNSDSGSDSQGAYGGDELYSDSDAEGTGERAAVGLGLDGLDGLNADIMPDRVEGMPGNDDADDAAKDDSEAFADVNALADEASDAGDEAGDD